MSFKHLSYSFWDRLYIWPSSPISIYYDAIAWHLALDYIDTINETGILFRYSISLWATHASKFHITLLFIGLCFDRELLRFMKMTFRRRDGVLIERACRL